MTTPVLVDGKEGQKSNRKVTVSRLGAYKVRAT